MLTRRQPVAIAASSDSSSRMPPLISTLRSRVADDPGLQLAVVAAAERRVEVHEVDPLGAGLLPAQRRLDRVAEPLLGAGHALDQLDGLAVRDVDGGQQLEVVRSRTSQPFLNSIMCTTGAPSRLATTVKPVM